MLGGSEPPSAWFCWSAPATAWSPKCRAQVAKGFGLCETLISILARILDIFHPGWMDSKPCGGFVSDHQLISDHRHPPGRPISVEPGTAYPYFLILPGPTRRGLEPAKPFKPAGPRGGGWARALPAAWKPRTNSPSVPGPNPPPPPSHTDGVASRCRYCAPKPRSDRIGRAAL